MAKDTRTVLDNIRSKIPGDAKLLVAWYREDGGTLVLAQANMSQADIDKVADSLKINNMKEKQARGRVIT